MVYLIALCIYIMDAANCNACTALVLQHRSIDSHVDRK